MSLSELTAQKLRYDIVASPVAIKDNTGWTCNVLDMNGYDSVTFLFSIGATDIAMAALKVQESDTASSATALSTGTDITGADFSVSPATLPADSADNTIVAVTIPWRGLRKRYCLLVATAGNGTSGTYGSCIAVRTPAVIPNTATGRGLGQHLIVTG